MSPYTAINDIENYIAKLEAEVAWLRGNADYEQTLGRKVDTLEAENHRLRAALRWALSRMAVPRLVRGQNDAYHAGYVAAVAALEKKE